MKWLLVSDVDDTLTGDDVALLMLGDVLAAHRADVTVAYNSSRPCASVRATIGHIAALQAPDYLIGALGTEIENGRTGERLADYVQLLSANWRRDEVDALARSLGFTPHPEEFQTPFKASYDIAGPQDYERFLSKLAAEGLNAKVIYSGQTYLDVLPENAGKGTAIRFLRTRLDVQPDHVIVAGDSGNDVDMFVKPFRGIVVGNADSDLKVVEGDHVYFASAHHAAGVLEGLRHWGVV